MEQQSPEQEIDPQAAEAVDESENPRLISALESILFASGEPMPLRRLVEILKRPTPAQVRKALEKIEQDCSARGIRLAQVAGGYQFRTAPENADYVRAVFTERPRRLGRAALETLSIIAYRQPVTRAEVEAIRGVDIDAVLNTLLQRNLIKVCGRKETVGRPLLYGTTDTFLELFGLRSLAELPILKEISAAEGEADAQAEGEKVEPQAAAAEGAHAETGEATGAELAGSADTPGGNSPTETTERGGSELSAGGGEPDSGGPGAGEREGGDGAGDEGGPGARSD